MNDIYIIFTHQAEIFFGFARQFHALNDLFSMRAIQPQSAFNRFWQNFSLEDISAQIDYAIEQSAIAGAENNVAAANALIDSCLKTLETERDIQKKQLWLFGWTYIKSYEFLKNRLDLFPKLAGARIHAILLAQKQEEILRQWSFRGWKKYSPDYLCDLLLKPGTFYYYDDAYAEMSDQFESVSVLTDSGDPAKSGACIWKDLGKILNIEMPGQFQLASYPHSYAGLDIARAVFDFPFTLMEKRIFDRNKFYELLLDVEKEEGFSLARPNFQTFSRKLREKFKSQNDKLAARLGRTALFEEGDDLDGDDLDKIPIISQEQCRLFVSAWSEDLRARLLRFFRDRDGQLSGEELGLAKTLEEYRQKLNPVSGFTFPRPEPLLSVLTMAYNHKDYILECMESVSAQKTDFPIEHIIVDDFSDDGTQDIIDDYASTHPHVRPYYLTWRSGGCESVRTLFNACHSEYAALCDGDDYFTAPHKLQKQVDFLKANPHCGLVFHPVRVVFENGERESFFYPPIQNLPRGMKKEYYLSDLTRGNLIQTNSVVYRWRFRDGLPDWFRADLCPGDWYWHMLHAELGKIGFIPEVMSVYRRHSGALYSHAFLNSVEHSRDTGMKSLEAYHIYNEHFKNRYFKNFANLAAGVFSDFVAIANSEGDTTLLDDAAKEYPEFARHFLELARKLENSPGSNEKA